MSYDDDDIVVAQVCGTRGCCSQVDLEFDVAEGEYYCGRCRDLASRVDSEGFHILLTTEEQQLVKMIFEAFSAKANLWTPAAFARFAEATGDHDAFLDSGKEDEDLTSYFAEEFDITVEGGVTLRNLEAMYGGYKYNNVAKLDEDTDSLSECGILRLGLLE